MTDPGTTSSNFAGGNAHVGVQAQNVDGDIAYTTVVLGDARFEVSPGATSEEKYQVGLNYLASGMVTKARELIWDAMMEGYQPSYARFHWLVAMLSGRTNRQCAESVLTPGRPACHLTAELPARPRSPRSTRAPTRSSAWCWPASS